MLSLIYIYFYTKINKTTFINVPTFTCLTFKRKLSIMIDKRENIPQLYVVKYFFGF